MTSETTPRDPSMEQTAAGISNSRNLVNDLSCSNKDRETIRTLAGRVAALASRPLELEKTKLWMAHNDLAAVRPLIFCDPENGWNEIIGQDRILCTTPLLRIWEMQLRKEIFWAEEMQDDRVIEPFFNVPYCYLDTGWGLEAVKHSGGNDGSYVWDAPLLDYETCLPMMHFPRIMVDHETTQKVLELADNLLGDILTVRLKGSWWWTLGLTWEFITLRGLTNFMLDMYDNPDGIHRTMAFLRDGTLVRLEFLEKEGLLSLNTGGTYVGSGGFGWTSQLPAPDLNTNRISLRDMWGFCESQETVGVSTEMFAEFVFPYQLPILEKFGLNCYGCCEPLDPRWNVIQKVPRLRRVSCSPWSDIPKMAELLGNKYIMSLKPSPSPLALPTLDKEACRQNLRELLRQSRGCVVELIMKDNHTLGGNPANATEWCRIAREEIARL